MTGILGDKAFAKVSLLAIGACIIATSASRIARAVDPDVPHMQAGAERGSIQQEIELGAAYLAGRGVARNEKQAAYWYEKAASAGDPGAQEQIGFFYQAGVGVDRDPVRAAQWFQRAVAGGLVSAKVNLGVAYVWGLGVRKDPAFGAQLFREAADKGSGLGACYLADMYFFGIGVPKDSSQAVHWLEVGVKRHNMLAEFDLALLLLKNPDHPSHERAVKLLRDSAKAGRVAAKHQLALELIQKPELARSPDEGVALLEEASAAGFWRSSVVLGVLYRDGREVTRDKKAAYYHFRIAMLQARNETATLLKNDMSVLSSELDPSQIEALDRDAAVWAQQHSRRFEYVDLQGEDQKAFPAFALEYPENGKHAGLLIGAPDGENGQGFGEAFLP